MWFSHVCFEQRPVILTLELYIGSERCQVGCLERLTLGYMIGRQRPIGGKRCQIQRGNDCSYCQRGVMPCDFCLLTVEDDDLVRCIDIQALVQRECERIVVQSCIGRRVVALDGGMREPGNKLLDVTDT